jgi:hypothetical protein
VAFDAQMNYPLAYPIADWLAIGRDATDAATLAERIRAVLNHDSAHDQAQMTLIASHDTERGGSLMQNGFDRPFDNGAGPWSERYGRDAVGPEARRRLLAAYALLVALPGSPMVYNGDEFALAGADDPDNRRPIPWDRLGDAERAFAAQVGVLLGLRADPEIGAVLRHGTWDVEPAGAGGDAVIVRRTLGGCMAEVGVARRGRVVLGAPPPGWSAGAVRWLDAGAGGPGDGAVCWRVLRADFAR